MQELIENGRDMVERSAFGVCQAIGDKLGIKASRVRLYFIYTSFIALGSPLILYLILAFWLNVKKYFSRVNSLTWD